MGKKIDVRVHLTEAQKNQLSKDAERIGIGLSTFLTLKVLGFEIVKANPQVEPSK